MFYSFTLCLGIDLLIRKIYIWPVLMPPALARGLYEN